MGARAVRLFPVLLMTPLEADGQQAGGSSHRMTTVIGAPVYSLRAAGIPTVEIWQANGRIPGSKDEEFAAALAASLRLRPA